MKLGQRKGFTLIELLVVIAIIGILSTLAIIALSSARQKARDSKRVADMNQISKALEVYYADNNSYPTLITPGQPISFGSTTYLAAVPSNPTPWNDNNCPNQNYMYGSDNQRYTLYYCLGSDTGQVKAGYNLASESGVNADASLVLRLDAGNPASYPGTGSVWSDLSGKGNNGTLTNGPTYSSANSGSFLFDGSDDFVQLGNILNGTGDFTVIAWLKNNQGGFPTVFGNYGTPVATGAMQFTWVSTKATRVYLENAYALNVSGSAYTPDVISQSAFTRSGNNFVGYANGQQSATGSSAASIPTTNFRIGANITSPTPGELFQGNIYQVLVYKRALSATEILANYTANRARYGL